MSIRSDASTVVMLVGSTLHIANVVKGFHTKKFSKKSQELRQRTYVRDHNEVHAITWTSTQRAVKPVRHVRMSHMCVVEVGDLRDQ
jgi:hypothetical protein